MTIFKAVLYTLANGWAASMVMGTVIILFGDCPTDPRPNGVARCYSEQHVIATSGLAIAALVYVICVVILWRLSRSKPDALSWM